jgi:hypothetical protein
MLSESEAMGGIRSKLVSVSRAERNGIATEASGFGPARLAGPIDYGERATRAVPKEISISAVSPG